MKKEPDMRLFFPPAIIEKQVNRLFRITGFVTILCKSGNSRNLAFARYYHVRRVVWTSHLIGEEYARRGLSFDRDKLNLMAWAHDLNRWPFSHNSEKGYYNQGADLERYMADNLPVDFPLEATEIRHIIDKNTTPTSPEMHIVLLADILTGFIEDPLWLTAAFNITPDIIPDQVADCLGIAKTDELLLEKLYRANRLFHTATTHEGFVDEFDALFQERMTNFLRKEDFFFNVELGSDYFTYYRNLIKEGFLVKVIFPYNNEKISQGYLIKQRLIRPFIEKTPADRLHKILTEVDEEQFMHLAVELGVITPEEIPGFYPRIDYIEHVEPDLSFRKQYEHRRSH